MLYIEFFSPFAATYFLRSYNQCEGVEKFFCAIELRLFDAEYCFAFGFLYEKGKYLCAPLSSLEKHFRQVSFRSITIVQMDPLRLPDIGMGSFIVYCWP